ncbi:MAG: hypothetical protein ACRD4K_09835 [Candidatus Acidiferrales bacterium]
MESNPQLVLNPRHTALEYWRPDGQLLWECPLRPIVLMAEYTTSEGPFVDDYFLVFVSKENEKYYFATASFYSDGREALIDYLSKKWGVRVELGLANSTGWKSRVVWPPEIAGRDYFSSSEAQPGGGLEKLRAFAFGPVHDYFPSQEVRGFLVSCNAAQQNDL